MLGLGGKIHESRCFAVSIWGMALLILASCFWAYQTGYRLNDTLSLPKGLYQLEKKQPGALSRGSIVLLCPPRSPWIQLAAQRGYIPSGECPGNFRPMLKPIAAIPGDTVTVSVQGIWVNQKLLANSAPLVTDSKGRPLNSIQAGAYQVKPGEVWLISSYSPKSFDSRYFGPISEKQIQSIAHPVLIGDLP